MGGVRVTGGGAIPIPTRPSLPLSSFPPLVIPTSLVIPTPTRHSERSEESQRDPSTTKKNPKFPPNSPKIHPQTLDIPKKWGII